ncbi:MAG: hypothetical protein ACREL5_09330 [Gemmatimonadales bacterium]
MKILCVSWHYPPSNEVGGKVVYRLLRALHARGHEVVVVTVPASAAVGLDSDYGNDMPDARIVRIAPWPDPFAALGRLERWILKAGRSEVLPAGGATSSGDPPGRLAMLRRFPDRARLWIPPARRAVRRLVRTERPGLMLSSSPFFSAHLAAFGVHRTHPGLPWWAWSRDPATGNPFNASKGRVAERRLARLEAMVVRTVARNIVTTDELADEYQRRYQRRPLMLRSGFDPLDLPPRADPPAAGPMVITHAGTLYGRRTPVPLFEAIAGLLRDGRIGPDDLRVRLIGNATDLAGESPQRAIARLGLGPIASVEAPISQHGAFAALLASHVGLVLAEGQPLQIPAKTFECVGLGRPVLAIADGATAALVERHHLGVVATTATISDVLLWLIAAFRQDRLLALSDLVVRGAADFAVDRQAELFERAVAEGEVDDEIAATA